MSPLPTFQAATLVVTAFLTGVIPFNPMMTHITIDRSNSPSYDYDVIERHMRNFMSNLLGSSGLQAALDAVASREAVKEIYFVACGGSHALLMQGNYVIDTAAQAISSQVTSSAEFLARNHKRLGSGSIVVVCSLEGATPETVAAAAYARKKGALTIAFTQAEGSPLELASEYTIHHTFNPLTIAPDHPTPLLLQLTFGILKVRENHPGLPAIESIIPKLTKIVDDAVVRHQEGIVAFAKSFKREQTIYTVASGSNYGIAYAFTICLLQEMLWINSSAIHSGEYFHGPFEITDFDVPFILLIGLGNSRKMDERALAFARKYSDRLLVLDAKEFGVEAIAGEYAEYFTPVLLNTVLRHYAVKLADDRGHPLTVRRYMWREQY
jgi:fructoselysine 6-phosphate deglycase